MKLFYNPSGTVKVLPVSVLPVNAVWNGGFPYTPEGSLLVSIVSAKPTDTVSNGGFIQELWGGVCAGYDTPSIWIGGLAITSYGALCLDVDGGIVTDGPALYNSLTHTAIPTRGDITPSFTRATTSTWPNNDGYLVTGVAGEIGFVGARRVRNLVTASEDLSNAAWSNVGSASHTAGTVTFTASASDSVTQVVAVPGGASGKTVVISMTVSVASGTGQFRLQADQGGVANGRSADKTATTTPTRFSFVRTNAVVAGTGNQEVGIINGTGAAAATFIVTDVQLEDVTAQTTQTAGEYVSVGVESAPAYHGSMVDGVKCFDTDINGVAIPSTTLLGYQAQGARTNLCLQSNDPSNASWTKSAFITTTQNTVSPDGATNAWTVTATAGATFAVFLQNITVAADTSSYTASCFIKKTTGTPATYPMFELQHSSATKLAGVVINTTAGTLTNRSVGGAIVAPDAKTITSWNDDYWRVTVTLANNSGTTSTIAFYPSINSDGTGVVVSGTLGSAVFYGAQVELGSFASSCIATTTIAVARNADVLTYPSAGNIDGTVGWCYAEATLPSNAATVSFVGATGGNFVSYSSSDSKLSVYDGTAERKGDSLSTSQVAQKLCTSWGGSSSQTAISGVASAVLGFDGDLNIGANLYIGVDTVSTANINGNIKNVRIGRRALSSSELQAVTA